MDNLFAAEEASPVNKRALYKQTKEAQLIERLERRMEGTDRQTQLTLLCAILVKLVSTIFAVQQASLSQSHIVIACCFLSPCRAQYSLFCLCHHVCPTACNKAYSISMQVLEP